MPRFMVFAALVTMSCVFVGEGSAQQPTAVQIVETSAPKTGELRILAQRYRGPTEGQPYRFAEIEIDSEDIKDSDLERAKMEMRFQLAGMALDAGWRHMEVSDFVPYYHRKPPPDRGILGSAITGLFTKKQRTTARLSGKVKFVQEPSPRTVDALESYNRFGRILFGERFQARTTWAREKMIRPYERPESW